METKPVLNDTCTNFDGVSRKLIFDISVKDTCKSLYSWNLNYFFVEKKIDVVVVHCMLRKRK